KPAEESRHAVLQHLAARSKQRRAGSHHFAQRQQIVFIAAGAVQEKQRLRAGARTGLETVNERELGHPGAFSVCSRRGSAASMSRRRASRKDGSSRSRPKLANGSSTMKPGRSVAISKRMPPGSRKYTDRKYFRSICGV